MSSLPSLVRAAFTLYALGGIIALMCIIDTTAVTMTLFFFVGVASFGLGFLAYAKAVWDDLREHGVL